MRIDEAQQVMLRTNIQFRCKFTSSVSFTEQEALVRLHKLSIRTVGAERKIIVRVIAQVLDGPAKDETIFVSEDYTTLEDDNAH